MEPVFRPKGRVTLAAVDALTDLPALQRGEIILQNPGSILPQQNRALLFSVDSVEF
jgi:hypothetical protein